MGSKTLGKLRFLADVVSPGYAFTKQASECGRLIDRKWILASTPPINPKQKPKAMSPTDPCAAWTTRSRHKVMFGYSVNYLIDIENAVILDVEATPTRIRLSGLTGARDEFLLTATVQNLKRLVKRVAIPPPIPVAA